MKANVAVEFSRLYIGNMESFRYNTQMVPLSVTCSVILSQTLVKKGVAQYKYNRTSLEDDSREKWKFWQRTHWVSGQSDV